jgi:hypothetical protein
MKLIIGFFIFCLVLFIYLHVQFHLKTSEDLEIYEVDQPSKNKLEEICDIRQPVLFNFDCEKILETTNKQYVSDHYHAFEVKIRNMNETDPNVELYIPLPMHSAMSLFDEDKKSNYFSENNSDFLEETGIIKNMKYNDEFLRPYMVSNCNYDIMMGSTNTCTPFRYELNYRNYFILTQGSAQIKLAPPQSTKYLYPNYDYENFEFKSPVDPWSPQPKFTADFDKIKCLEFTLTPGNTLFIPAYWWYSIKFHANTSISCFRYRTYMNNIAIFPYIGMHALQIQNVKRNVIKKASITQINHEILSPVDKNELQETNIINETRENNVDISTTMGENLLDQNSLNQNLLDQNSLNQNSLDQNLLGENSLGGNSLSQID